MTGDSHGWKLGADICPSLQSPKTSPQRTHAHCRDRRQGEISHPDWWQCQWCVQLRLRSDIDRGAGSAACARSAMPHANAWVIQERPSIKVDLLDRSRSHFFTRFWQSSRRALAWISMIARSKADPSIILASASPHDRSIGDIRCTSL